MRVTKIVREYIEESVSKKYQPLRDAINKKYEPIERAYDEAVAAAKAEAKEVWAKHLSSFYTEEELRDLIENHTEYVPSYYRIGMHWREERNERECALRNEENNTIKNILVTLELGGTKADLDRMLSEIDPEEEENE